MTRPGGGRLALAAAASLVAAFVACIDVDGLRRGSPDAGAASSGGSSGGGSSGGGSSGGGSSGGSSGGGSSGCPACAFGQGEVCCVPASGPPVCVGDGGACAEGTTTVGCVSSATCPDGGGGIPVVADEHGHLRGIAAVIDKDFASSLLATRLGADTFIISTAVEKVALNFGKPEQRWLDRVTLAEARQYLAEGTHFAKGSMAPKIQAIINFLEAGGQHAIVTDPANIARALAGETGTHFVQ